jgi:hypothetical protein
MHLAFETKTQGERFMKNKLNLIRLAVVAALSLGVCNLAQADEATVSSTPAPTPAGPTVTYGGGLDTYYQFNAAGGKGIVNPTGRVFDQSDNTFRVGLAKFSIDAKEKTVGGHIDLIYGQDADLMYGYPSTSKSTAIGLENAYATYSPTAKWTFTLGKFATGIGYEVIESWLNPNYSRSYAFGYTIPFEHTGVKAAYTFSDKYNAMLMVANSGWADESSANQSKTAHLQFIGNPSGKFGFVANLMAGDEYGYTVVTPGYISGGVTFPEVTTVYPATAHQTKEVGELILNFNPTSKIYAGLDLTYGQKTLTDPGVADNTDVQPYNAVVLYASYAFSPAWKLSGRLERMNDKEDVTGLGAPSVQEGTLTLAYKVGNLVPRAEFRYDEALDGNGDKTGFFAVPSGLVSTQKTYTLGVAYTF